MGCGASTGDVDPGHNKGAILSLPNLSAAQKCVSLDVVVKSFVASRCVLNKAVRAFTFLLGPGSCWMNIFGMIAHREKKPKFKTALSTTVCLSRCKECNTA